MTIQTTNSSALPGRLHKIFALAGSLFGRKEMDPGAPDAPDAARTRRDIGLAPRNYSGRDALDRHMSSVPFR